MDFSVGQVVYSKCGRDRKRPFIVVAVENEYLFLADGVLRLLEHPKKKKIKHVQKTNTVYANLQNKLEKGDYINNKEIEKILTVHQRG